MRWDAISRLKTAVLKKEVFLGNKVPIESLVSKPATSRFLALPRDTLKETDDFEFMFCFLGRGNDGSFRRTVSLASKSSSPSSPENLVTIDRSQLNAFTVANM